MIIDAKTIAFTLAIVGVASYFGLQLIRSFALSIAQENHDANLATDMSVEAKVTYRLFILQLFAVFADLFHFHYHKRARREQEADAAALAAFAKVEPLLPANIVNKGMDLKTVAPSKPSHAAASTGGPKTLLGTEDESIEKDNTVDEEAPLTAVSDSADEIPADEFNNANDEEKI